MFFAILDDELLAAGFDHFNQVRIGTVRVVHDRRSDPTWAGALRTHQAPTPHNFQPVTVRFYSCLAGDQPDSLYAFYQSLRVDRRALILIVRSLCAAMAGANAIGRTVTLRRSETDWVRVTDITYNPRANGHRTTVFEYHGLGKSARNWS